jgi:hypothetical protein
MWEEIDENVVRKIVSMERNEAQKKFWAIFMLWVLIAVIWLVAVRSPSNTDVETISSGFIQISYLLLFLLLGTIILLCYYEYNRCVRPVIDAKYMITAPCEGRERMDAKGRHSFFQGYYVSFRKPDKRMSGWVQVSQEFYQRCTIGTMILVTSVDQIETAQMRAFDPEMIEM